MAGRGALALHTKIAMRVWTLVCLSALASPLACSIGTSGESVGDAGQEATPVPSGSSDAGNDVGTKAPDSGDAGQPTSGGEAGTDADAAPAGPGRGATLPYVEYEAENGTTNGTILGPSRAVNDPNVFNSIAGESSGRRAVKLAGTGQYVRLTTTAVANSVVVRFAIPDSQDGSGETATLGLYVNGARVQSLSLTSQYAWAYGDPETTDSTTNTPTDGYARHFYDEARILLPADVPAGSTVALQQDAMDTAAYYVVDLVDLEEAPAAPAQPPGTLSVSSYGATGNGTTDDGPAIQSCIDDAEAKGMSVWLPPGTYVDASTALDVKNVAIYGAGMWRTTITGTSARFVCGGGGCQISDLALLGDVTLRDDGDSISGIGGTFGTGSQIVNVWVEHFTTGAWIGVNGNTPTTDLLVHGARIRDLYADGINLCNGTSDSTIEQSSVRNSGDDGFASWAYAGAGDPANAGNVFQFDTVQIPWRANCFAIYGGQGNAVEDDLCADAVTYPGVFVDQEFDSHPFAGTTTIARDTILRSGGLMYGTQWGALTVSGHDMAAAMTGVAVSDVDVEDATYAGLLFIGPGTPIDGLSLTGVAIDSPGTYGVAVDPTASGSATAASVVVMNPGTGGLSNGAPSAWTFTRLAGDTGW
jgi:hypothetical protein